MNDLMRKLLGKPKAEITFEEGMNFFRANGVEIEKLNFPNSKERNVMPLSRYWCGFSDLRAQLEKEGGNPVTTTIKGNYHIQAMTSYRDENRDWHPGTPVIANFSIRNNRLSLEYL